MIVVLRRPLRAVAIAVFYAVGTGAGGFVAPVLFGMLIETGSRGAVTAGYGIGAALVVIAGFLALRFAVDAERKPLEEIAPPLSSLAGHDIPQKTVSTTTNNTI